MVQKLIFFNDKDKILFQDNEVGDEDTTLWAWNNAQLYFINSSITSLRDRTDLFL
jgi:hypothetical protein